MNIRKYEHFEDIFTLSITFIFNVNNFYILQRRRKLNQLLQSHKIIKSQKNCLKV
jgi:hypothetical protein